MSWFLAEENGKTSDEKKVNVFINSSFLAKIYILISGYLQKFFGKYFAKINLEQRLDDIYFIFLAILFFSIPFAKTGVIGFWAFSLILITFIKSLFFHKKFAFSTLHVPIIVWLMILLISVGFSSLVIPSLKGLAKMLIYIGGFFSFFEYLKHDSRRILAVIGLIAMSASLELLFSLKQMIFGVNELAGWQDKTYLNPELAMNRVFGTLKPLNPNLFAGYLLAAIPSVFAIFAIAFSKKYRAATITFGSFSILGLVTLVQTGCRGAYIGVFFGFILLAYLLYKMFKHSLKISRKKLTYIILGVVAIICILIALSPALSHRLASIFTFRGDSSNSYRMNVYISSFQMLLDNFWIGIGPGNSTYRLIYGLYMKTGFDALGAYNIYLEMAIESGIFAFLSFFWLIVLGFYKGIKRLMLLSLEYKIVMVAVLVSIFSMLAHGLVDTVWYRPQIQIIFWVYVAIIATMTMKGFSDAK